MSLRKRLRDLVPQARLTLVGALLILTVSFLTESFPLLLGAGRSASVDWGFAYVTLRFILLPGASIALIVFGLVGLVPSTQAHHHPSVVVILASLTVPVGFLALSYFIPLPWLEILIHGTQVPAS